MVHFFFQEVELLLETGHHLGSKAGRRVHYHVRHGLGHERQDELRAWAFSACQVLPGGQAAFIVIRFLEDFLQAFADAVRFIPDDDALFSIIQEGVFFIILDRQGNGQDPGFLPLFL